MNTKLIICPNEEKNKLLLSLSKEEKLIPYKFMSKEEFIKKYYFDYDIDAIYYLRKKYNYNIDVCRVYLNNLYKIDINKEYKNNKCNFLKDLKKELIDNNLLIFSKSFKEYIKDKEIIVKNYYDLDKYEEEALNYKVTFNNTKLDIDVLEYETLEDEVRQTILKIIDLIKRGVELNKIVLCNVNEDYYYTINKLFGFYNIPINIPYKNSIYSTKIVSDYLKDFNLNIDNNDNISKKLVSVLNDFSKYDLEDTIIKELLIDRIKHTNISNKKIKNAVNIRNLFNETFNDDEYVFVLGFNQDFLPEMKKDIEYLSDKDKEELSSYTTNELNKREKLKVIETLSNIKNLTISYKLSSPFQSYYKSSLIEEYNLNVKKEIINTLNYSNIYNKIYLGELLDNYYLYGEKNNNIDILNNTYNIPYNTYNNSFTGIDNFNYLKNLDYPLKLSYTSLNSYNECRFKYYLNYVLKLGDFESTFQSFIGSMYHKILSLYRKSNFNLEDEWQKYIETRELSLSEKIFLIRIKKDLIKLIDIIKKQDLLTGYDDYLFENKFEVDISTDVKVSFIGYIDKIMMYKKVEDTYFSIIDYKTGTIDTHIEPMRYGLHMQLPVYLYLVHYSKNITNPIFTGIYYQNILFDYPKYEDKDKEIDTRYFLNGYSTDNIEVLERFDSTYEKSEWIKGLKYTEDKGFDRYSKTISNDLLFSMLKYTKNHIEEKRDEILSGNFKIDPKVYGTDNISCKYCKFRDICFTRADDITYLEKQNDLSFLGGEE